VLSAVGAAKLCREAAAVDFVRDAYGRLRAIFVDNGAMELSKKAGLEEDSCVIGVVAIAQFVEAAKNRHWGREASVRTLA
jgi:catalase